MILAFFYSFVDWIWPRMVYAMEISCFSLDSSIGNMCATLTFICTLFMKPKLAASKLISVYTQETKEEQNDLKVEQKQTH